MSQSYYERFVGDVAEMDGRLRHASKGEKWGAAGPITSRLWEPVFCYCGRPGGYVTKGTPVIYVCQLCHESYGDPPLPKIPGTDNL